MTRFAVGKNIRILREKQKLSQTQLAKKAKVSLNTIVFLENDRTKNPTIGTLYSIALALNVHVEKLLRVKHRKQ
jgi:transcriptional regulator with XRE-family HTH domain